MSFDVMLAGQDGVCFKDMVDIKLMYEGRDKRTTILQTISSVALS